MKVTSVVKTNNEVKVGDIIVTDGKSYLVVSRTEKSDNTSSREIFELRNFLGNTTRNGEHYSIESMIKSVIDLQGDYKHYSADEYELTITKKERS